MRKKLSVEYFEYKSVDELGFEDRNLVEEATKMLKHAYAPYSKFLVGCALQLSNGSVVTGSNQENAAYPSGLCAERVALFTAKSTFPDEAIETVVICASKDNMITDLPIAPCGGCRQVFIEVRNRQETNIKLILVGQKKIQMINDATLLMPFSFSKNNL